MKKVLLAFAACVASAFAAWWIVEALRSDEARIRAIVDECVEAARERRPGRILAHVADDFRSPGVITDKEMLRTILMHLQLQIKVVEVDVAEGPAIAVADDGKTATAVLKAAVRLGTTPDAPATDLMVGRARGSDVFRLRLEKRDGEWRIVLVDVP